jgi:hypothetical protein
MRHSDDQMLAILDRCCDAFTFPMLDNGYVYLAASRLSLFVSPDDWALVIEVFGYSPRAGLPDTQIYTFGSTLHNRKGPDRYVTREAYNAYLINNPNNDSHIVFPVEAGPWIDEEEVQFVALHAEALTLRGRPWPVPNLEQYRQAGVELALPPRVQVFELCRALAHRARDDVLGTPDERRFNVPPDLRLLLTLDEWAHPDVVDDAVRPSGSETFQQLARVLATGDAREYRPAEPPNTHWRHWPEGGTL